MALTLNGQRKFQTLTQTCFDRLIENLGIEPAAGKQLVADFVEAAMSAWRQAEVQSNYTKQQRSRLQSHLDSIPLINESLSDP